PPGILVESVRGALRSANRASGPPRHGHSGPERQGPEPRRDHPRADRWTDRQRAGHHRNRLGGRLARARGAAAGNAVPLRRAALSSISVINSTPIFVECTTLGEPRALRDGGAELIRSVLEKVQRASSRR